LPRLRDIAGVLLRKLPHSYCTRIFGGVSITNGGALRSEDPRIISRKIILSKYSNLHDNRTSSSQTDRQTVRLTGDLSWHHYATA